MVNAVPLDLRKRSWSPCWKLAAVWAAVKPAAGSPVVGGLLVAVQPAYVAEAISSLQRHGVRGSVIGEVVEKAPPLIGVS